MKLEKAFFVMMALTVGVAVGCAESAAEPNRHSELAAQGVSPVIISGEEAQEIYKANGSVVLLDVRSQDEFDVYHIPGSVLITSAELESRLNELPDKNSVIIVFCRSGGRSTIAAKLLVDNGFKHVYDMQKVENWGGS